MLDPAIVDGALTEKLSKDDIEIGWSDASNEEIIDVSSEFKAIHIFGDELFSDFDPILRRNLLEVSSYEMAFGDLIRFLDDEIQSLEEG